MRLLPDFLRETNPRLRRSLLWATADAALFSAMDGLGAQALGFYAVALGMSNLAIGLLGSVPFLAGSLSQLLSPVLERLCGSRKRAVLLGCLVHAVVWLLLPGVAHLPPGSGREALLVALVSVGTAGWFITIPPWSSWMGDLVPAPLRSRFLAWRLLPCQLCSLAAILGMGWWMSGHEDRLKGEVAAFQFLFFLAAAFRLLSIACLAFQHEPAPSEAEPEAAVPPPREGFERTAAFFALFHLVLFVSAPYFSPYMREVRLDYWRISWLLAMTPLAKMLFLPAWGRAAERYGNRRVILVSGMLTSFLPVLWMFSADWRWLLAVQAVNGMVWGGIELCELPYLWDHTSPSERTRKTAGYFSLRSLCDCLGGVLGDRAIGWHAVRFSGSGPAGAFRFSFLLSGIGRLGALLWGWRILKERQPERRHTGPRRVLAEVLTLR